MKSQKHTMYKPVSQGQVGSKSRRKPLAQGRLNAQQTEPSLGSPKARASESFSRSFEKKQNLSNQKLSTSLEDEDDIINIVSRVGERGNQDENILDIRAANKSNNGNALFPRDERPLQSLSESPKLARPSRVLDISDSDSDRSPGPPDVVVIDARGQRRDANVSEVNINVGYERSPVKVTCHSPGKVQSDLRNTGSVEIGRRVAVDQVPSVSVLADNESSDDEGVMLHKSPLVVRESTIAGSRIDPHSTAKPALVKTLFHSLLEEPEEVPQRATYPRPVSTEHNESASSLASLKENIDQDYGPPGYPTEEDPPTAVHRPPKMPKGMTLGDNSKVEKKKKKAPRFVSSRYMQTTQPKGPMKATDRSLISKSSSFETSLKVTKKPPSSGNLNNSASSNRSYTRKSSSAKKTKPNTSLTSRPSNPKTSSSNTKKFRTLKNSSASGTSFGSTPEIRPTSRLVSTPSNESFPSPSDVDVSAIESVSGRSRLHSSVDRNRSRGAATPKDYTLADEQHVSTSKPSSRKSERVSQWDLELLYSRFMQFVYLDSKAKKSFQEQEASSMTYLYGLWEENDKQRRRKAELEQQLAHMQHLNALDDTLEVQKSGLKPVASSLSQVINQYPVLAEALDTTRHQIRTKGVYIPQDDEAYSDALLQAFNESEQLLGELSVMSRQDTPKITNLSNSLDVTGKCVRQELGELSKCQKSMSDIEKKTMHELALYSRSWNLM